MKRGIWGDIEGIQEKGGGKKDNLKSKERRIGNSKTKGTLLLK